MEENEIERQRAKAADSREEKEERGGRGRMKMISRLMLDDHLFFASV